MRITHQLKDQKIERDVHESIPLGFFVSNKIGGMLYFDTKKDQARYYAHIKGNTIKVLHDLNIEGKPYALTNNFHSLAISRSMMSGKGEHEIFAPYYMNAFSIKSQSKEPFQIVLHATDVQTGVSAEHHAINEKDGRIIIHNSLQDPRDQGKRSSFFTAIQGDNLAYDMSKDPATGLLLLEVISPATTISIAETEDEAVRTADHLHNNADKIKEIQENYLASFKQFKDPEASMAYACVLNGTDQMFLPQAQADKALRPMPFFSEVTRPHTAIAAHALLTEGEFGIVKRTIFSELEEQLRRLQTGNARFHEIAWTTFLFGKLLNHLCAHEKLYNYFSTEDLKSSTISTIKIIENLTSKYQRRDGGLDTEYGNTLEAQALLLSIYNFAHALTKKPEYAERERELAQSARAALFRMDLADPQSHEPFAKDDLQSFFLAAYTYPLLLSQYEWKLCFNNILERLHGSFDTLQSKMSGAEPESPLKLEHFGLTSLAALVMYRTDPETYEKTVNSLMRKSVSEVLYKGVIGRPSSSYRVETDPEKEAFVTDTHLLNNALFLEMLRECA